MKELEPEQESWSSQHALFVASTCAACIVVFAAVNIAECEVGLSSHRDMRWPCVGNPQLAAALWHMPQCVLQHGDATHITVLTVASPMCSCQVKCESSTQPTFLSDL